MNEITKVWSDGSLVNHSVIDTMTPEQLDQLAEILDKIK